MSSPIRPALLLLAFASLVGCRALNQDPWRWASPLTPEALAKAQAWGAGIVWRQAELRRDFRRGADDRWFSTIELKGVFWIRDTNGGTGSRALPLPDNVEIEAASVRVIWPGRVPLEFGAEVIEDEASPDGGRRLYLQIPAHPAGTTVQVHLRAINRRPRAWAAQGLVFGLPVEDYLFEVHADPHLEIEMALYNPSSNVTMERPKDAQKFAARVRAKDVPAQVPEELSPDPKHLGPWWTLRVADTLTYRLALSGLDLWYWAFVSQTGGLEEETGSHLPQLSAEPDLEGCGDRLCRVGRALAWLERGDLPELSYANVGDELRAAGDGQALPRARLLWAALHRAGMPVRWALAAPRGSATFDPERPNPVAVTYPLLYLPATDDAPPLWIDPGCTYCQPGEVEEQYVGTSAVLGWGRGGPAPFTMAQVQANLPTPSQRTIRWQVRLDGQQNSVDVEVELEGRIRQEVLAKQLKMDDATSARGVEDWIKERSSGATCSEIQPFPKSKEDPVRRLRCALPRLVRQAGPRWEVPLEVLSSRWDGSLLATMRRAPIEVRHSELEVEEITLQLPPGLQVISSPSPRRTSGELFDVELKVQKIGDTLLLRRTVRAQRGRVTAGRYTQEKAVLDEARALRGEKVVLAPGPG